MSLETVTQDLAYRAPHVRIIEAEEPTPTVATAALVHGVAEGQIAKTLAFWVGGSAQGRAVLVVAGGTARIDNKKFKDYFGVKGKMLNAEEVLKLTSHPVGGVCPFGLPAPVEVFLDNSLRAFDEVMPAAGSTHSMVKLSIAELVQLTRGVWVDFAQTTPVA
jgi:prolyl-tRNA editing enzyme YbaK/EbsC (Cys-tRNA(Pro) deacylase)